MGGLLKIETFGLFDMVVQLRAWGAIHVQAEQFGPAVVAGAIHQDLSRVNQRQVEIGYYLAFAGPQWLAQNLALGRDDRGEEATRDRANRATRVGHDLRLLV